MGFTIDLKLEAEKLKKDLDLIGEHVKKNLQVAIKQLSKNVYNEADRLAAQKLVSTRETYRTALKYEQLSDDTYVIYLDPQSVAANAVEKGWAQFDMKPGLLNGPKSRTNKKGKRYNIVPFQQHPYSKEPAKQVVQDMREAIQSITKDKTIKKTIKKFNDKTITVYQDIENPMLKGLTKVTSPVEGKKTKQTQYLIFRMVTENTDPSKFIHPGYSGARIFKDLEKYVQTNIDKILRSIL